MDSAQAVGTYKTPFYETHLPKPLSIETDSQEFPEVSEFRKLSNRFSEKPILIELTLEQLAERFIPESPINGRVDLFSYLDKNDEKLSACNLGIRRCLECNPEENLSIVGYEQDNSPRKNKINVRFLKKIGGLPDKTLPRYFFNHGEGFGSTGDGYCPSCYSKIRQREKFNRYMITTA